MNKTVLLQFVVLFIGQANAQKVDLNPQTVTGRDVNIVNVTFLGKPAIRLDVHKAGKSFDDLAILKNTAFKNGTIEVDVAGERKDKTDSTARGFIGVAFRVQARDSTKRYECFYLRLTNGRANDQIRRNHATQYVAIPGYDFARLRKESPGMYEAYADLEETKWIKVKIVVHNEKAQLYIGDSSQPCLIVNELKHGISEGAIALKTDEYTITHFRKLKISQEE